MDAPDFKGPARNDSATSSTALATASIDGKITSRRGGRRNLTIDDKITPNASAAILLSEGLSITDMHNQVVSISEELRTAKSEKQRVELYLDQILQEVKHKAPMIDSLTNDYRRAVESHDMLSARMNKMQRAMTKVERERDELKCETVKLQRESEDLSRQVQSLLQEQTSSSSDAKSEAAPSCRKEISSSSDANILVSTTKASAAPTKASAVGTLRRISECVFAKSDAAAGASNRETTRDAEISEQDRID
jgi:chromosome segregation ATPase